MDNPQHSQNFSELLVVGSGISALTMALAGAQAGFRVALSDKGALDAPVQSDARSYALAPASMNLFSALGIGGPLRAKAQPVSRMEIGDARPGIRTKSLIKLNFSQDDVSARGPDALAVIIESRWILEVLRDAVRQESRITRPTRAALSGIEQIPGAVRAHFADGTGIEAQMIVGADGRASAVREICAIDVSTWAYKQTGVAATLTHEKPHHGVAYDFFFDSGPLGVLPLPGHRSSIVWCDAPEAAAALLKLPAPAFCAELNRRLDGRLGALSLEGERSAFPLSLAIAGRMVAPRAALIADAAHGVHPLAGQGLNLGLRDVAALLDVLADARGLGLDLGGETTLERYQRWRRFDNLTNALAFDSLNRVFGWRAPPMRALRDAGLALTNAAAPVRKFLAREAAGLSDAAPRLLRGESIAPV